MKVKCIKENGIFAKLGEIFEVEKETSYGYILNTEFGKLLVWKSDFEIVKEDKMENRIVRKLEGLDGLENGMGLKVSFGAKGGFAREIILRVNGNEFATSNQDLVGACNLLKAMGFEFEYKSLRSLEEVIEEMRLKSLDRFGSYEYKLFSVGSINKNSPYLAVEASGHFVGEYLFNKEQAQKYADELNEIIEVGK